MVGEDYCDDIPEDDKEVLIDNQIIITTITGQKSQL